MTGFTTKVVETIWDRDAGACARCGRTVDPDYRGVAWSVHHRRPRGMGGSKNQITNSAVNGVILCGSGTTGCHGQVEADRVMGRRDGWLVPSWADPAVIPVRNWWLGLCHLRESEWVPLTPREVAEWAAGPAA